MTCYCFSPGCLKPQNPDGTLFCTECGSSLVLAGMYRAIGLLGQGGSSRTFLAVNQTETPPMVCIVQQLWGAKCQAFQQEFKPLDELRDHPQLPRVLKQFEQDNLFYLVQEYIRGDNLATILAQKGKFTVNQIWQVLESLLPVIDWMHTFGLIHCDLKPENIISRDSSKEILADLVLVDFGSAQFPPEAIIADKISGSPSYAAPEQLLGKPVLASDLYSLGMTCIHLLTGIHPFNLLNVNDQGLAWRNYWSSDQETPDNQQLAAFLDRLIASDLNQRITSTPEALQEIGKLRGKKAVPKSVPLLSPWQCYATLVGHQGLFASVNAVAIAPDGQIIASASDDLTIRLWDRQTGKELLILQGHTQFVKSVDFHPQDQNILVSGSWDRTIRLWDISTKSQIKVLAGHQNKVNVVLFHRDGTILASGSSDKLVKLWHPATGEMITSLKGHKLAVTALAFNGLFLASASVDSTIKLWDYVTFKLIHTLIGHIGTVKALAFSPNGQWLATGGEDRTIRLWDLDSRKCIQTLSGHPWLISSLIFWADGETLISGSWDKTVKLWEVKTGSLTAVLTGHTDAVSSVAITPDQSLIVSASNDQTVKLWKCI